MDLLTPLIKTKMNCKEAQLTTRGVLQHQQNGRFLRDTYKHLLDDWPNAIKKANLVSTEYSRTILSLISLLSALDSWCQTYCNHRSNLCWSLVLI